MNPALRRSAAHVFVESLDAPNLSDDDQHHLRTVLRLRDGEPVSVGDGDGRWRLCRFRAGDLDMDGDIVAERAPAVVITIGFAIPKGDRPEWIVQKLTEIGVDRIVLVDAERGVVRWDQAKVSRQLERLVKVAREAAMQSRRVRLPRIEGPHPAISMAAAVGPVAFAEPGGVPPSLANPMLVVGPEGGWSPAELEQVPTLVSLGATILRVETAAISAAVQLAALRDQHSTL